MRISDWSSDVCSSDLGPIIFIEGVIARSIHCLQLIEHICEPYSFVVIGAAFEEACTGDRMRFGTLMAGEDLIRHVIGGTGEVDEFLDWPNPHLDVEPPWALATGLFWRVEVADIGCSCCHGLSAPQAGLRDRTSTMLYSSNLWA